MISWDVLQGSDPLSDPANAGHGAAIANFAERFQGRAAWWSALLDNGAEVITCGCCQNGYTYGCDTSSVWRPTDFAAFREAQRKAGLTDEIFVQMTDWLEARPDVYVDYG